VSAVDTIPAAVGVPAGVVLWGALLWPVLPERFRKLFRRHKWETWTPLGAGLEVRQCTAHASCVGMVRYYNAAGVRICDVRSAEQNVGWCDLHHGHIPRRHYNITADRTWS
jgi:hypothetical protein